ncbi:hypothetical protein LC593_11955 [Nostoc sp. CHAB 5844]|nr:hypothetical protein [Nostoc sp. CHAB 5844]
MKLFSNIIFFITIVICVAALAISIYPGVLSEIIFVSFVLFFIGLPIVAAIGIFLLIALIVLAQRGKLDQLQLNRKFKNFRISWRRVAMMVAIVVLSGILLKFQIPRRLAFRVSKPAFEQMLVQAPVSSVGDMKLNRQLGLYYVDEYAADPRGGVYFRVYSSRWIFQITSYGFVYKPNSKGSPFGSTNYQTFRIFGNWYWFEDSTDWD